MPLERGSAATTEMLSVVLLLHKGLRFEYTNSLIMDLAAYFAGGRDAFVEQFKESLVPQMEDEFSISELVGSLSFDNTYLDETLDLSSEEEENISSCIVS